MDKSTCRAASYSYSYIVDALARLITATLIPVLCYHMQLFPRWEAAVARDKLCLCSVPMFLSDCFPFYVHLAVSLSPLSFRFSLEDFRRNECLSDPAVAVTILTLQQWSLKRVIGANPFHALTRLD